MLEPWIFRALCQDNLAEGAISLGVSITNENGCCSLIAESQGKSQ